MVLKLITKTWLPCLSSIVWGPRLDTMMIEMFAYFFVFKISFHILFPCPRSRPTIRMKKIDNTNGKIYHVHGLEELILLNWPEVPGQSADSMQLLSKCQNIYHRTRTNNSKICTEKKRPQITKTILRKKNKAGRTTLLDFKLLLQSHSNQNSTVVVFSP